jgi:hypothetical protein
LQFYSTVYFESDSARSFKWRSGSRVLSGSMSDLADITGYPFFPEPVEGYASVVQHSRTKQALAFAYGSGGTIGRTKGMIPLYHALRQIFRVSLSPKAGSSDEFWGTAIDLLVFAHERKRIDVLDFMFEEMMACVFEKKAGVYAPFIQALIERKHPNLESLARHFPVSLPVRNTKFKPIVHPDLVRGKKAKSVPSAARAGASSSHAAPAMDPAGLAQTVMSSPSFSKKEKNMFFAGFNNLFKMCRSTSRRQVREVNLSKRALREQKAARALETGEPQPAGSEDLDSTATDYPNPCFAYIPEDEDDDAGSAPPLV